MMKKYFLKGKEFINKKLEQLEIETSNVDYISEQIPNRLKQPLSVLRNAQIDLEDAHDFDPYFKNYPNHHLSHFLLDKYLMLEQGHTDAPQYLPPPNKNTFIPNFDENLEKKALLLKQAIQQYDEGFNKTDQPILCMCVIHFHHKRGTQIEYRYPKNKTVDGIENDIVHHAMPDSSHNKHEDYNFFNFQSQIAGKRKMLFGVSYFKQIKLTEQMKKNNSELTRSYLQKAVAIVSTIPMFGYLKMRLSITTKVFFEQFSNFDIIQLAYKDINKHLTETWPQMQLTDLNIGSDLKVIIDLFGASQFYEIWKAVLYQKRIVIFAHSSSSASSFILSLISLFPGLNTFGIYSKPISKYMQSLRQYALPLRLFSSLNFLSISFHIQDFHLLEKFVKNDEGNFLLGTTNRLLKETNNDYGIELLVNLENCTIEKRKSRRTWQSLSKKQKTFVSQLEEMVGKAKNFGYGGSEDCIRDHFHNFLKGGLVEMANSIKLFKKFMKDCEEYETKSMIQVQKKQKKSQYEVMNDEDQPEQPTKKDKNGFPPIIPSDITNMIFPQLLLNKSFAYFLQFHNQNLPEIVLGKMLPSLYINNYDYFLRINEKQFISYNWLTKKLVFGYGTDIRNFEGKQIKFAKVVHDLESDAKDQAKYVYVGNVFEGKFHRHGFYVDENEHYEGEYFKGVKEGYGKYTTPHEKYIGNFHHNLYHDQGQLIVDENIYVGEFQQGLRSGYGCNQGSFVFEGYWENDKPLPISQKTLQKQEKSEQPLNEETGTEKKKQNSNYDKEQQQSKSDDKEEQLMNKTNREDIQEAQQRNQQKQQNETFNEQTSKSNG